MITLKKNGANRWDGRPLALQRRLHMFMDDKGRLPRNVNKALKNDPKLNHRANMQILSGLMGPKSEKNAKRRAYLERTLSRGDTLEWAYFLYVRGELDESHRIIETLLQSEDVGVKSVAKRFKYFTERRWEPGDVEREDPLIFQFWDKEIPQDVATAVDQWRDLFGQKNHKLFEEESARELVREHCGASKLHAWDSCWSAAMKADLFRLVALHRYGGIYIDADLAVTPDSSSILRQLSASSFVISMTNSSNFRVTNMLLGARPGWELMAETLNRAFHNLETDSDKGIMALTGPILLTSLALEMDGKDTKSLRANLARYHIAKGYSPDYKKSDLYWKNQQRNRVIAEQKRLPLV